MNDRCSFPRIPPAKGCCPTGLGLQHSLSAGFGSGWLQFAKKTFISQGYQSFHACTVHTVCTWIFPRLCNFDCWNFSTEVCLTNFIPFVGNHHGRCQLLSLSGPTSRARQHWKICRLPQQRAPILSHATSSIQFASTLWDEVYNQMI